MEEIREHVVNPANALIRIEVMDGPGDGGACHEYRVTLPPPPNRGGLPGSQITLSFQNGPIPEAGVNGITHEVLLAILAHRLRGFQTGKFACDENAEALKAIEHAQEVLQKRTKDRMARNVEGTHEL